MRTIPEPVKKCVANIFSHKLHALLGKATMKHIVTLNATPEYKNDGICATHNYCDANEVMLEALETVGIKPFDNEAEPNFDLMNEIWTIARENNFQPVKI